MCQAMPVTGRVTFGGMGGCVWGGGGDGADPHFLDTKVNVRAARV